MADNQAPDFIPDDQFKPDGGAQASTQTPQQDAPDFIPDDQFKADGESQPSGQTQDEPGLMESFQAGESALERKLTFGASDWARTHIDPYFTGKTSEETAAGLDRMEEEHPVASTIGGAIGTLGAIAGTEGVAGAAGITQAISGLGSGAKIAAHVLKGGLEAGLFSGGDEVSDYALGKADPNDPVGAAISHMTASGLFGAATGGVFGLGGAAVSKFAKSGVGTKLAQWAEDFGKQWLFDETNPELLETVHKELGDLHSSMSSLGDETWGSNGIKAQAVANLGKDLTPEQLLSSSKKVNSLIENASPLLKDDAEFQAAVNEWKNSGMTAKSKLVPGAYETNPSGDVAFTALDNFKKKLQAMSKFESFSTNREEQAFRGAAKDLALNLRQHLEDTNSWGKLGDLQKGLNKAASDFFPKSADFVSKFTEKLEKSPEVTENRVNTFLNQVDKSSGSTKKIILGKYLDAAQKYRDAVGDLYSGAGVQSPISPVGTPALNHLLGESSLGGKAAKILRKVAPGKLSILAGTIGGSFVGGAGGALVGREVGSTLEPVIGQPLTKATGAALMKVIQSGAFDSTGEALSHANNIQRGFSKAANATEALFATNSKKAWDNVSNNYGEKINKYLNDNGLDQQIQNTQNDQKNRPVIPTPAPSPKGYAAGGIVVPDSGMSNGNSSGMGVVDGSSGAISHQGSLGAVYPDQDMVIKTAKARVFNYLKGMKPADNPGKLAFDHEPDQEMQQKIYDKTVKMAADPLSILNHVKDGSLTPDELGHFKNMFPEVHQFLSKQIGKKIAEKQQAKEMPHYKTRQGLSMFLGNPVDSTFTPSSIMAAQAVFANQALNKAAMAASQGKKPRNTAKMGDIAKQYQTAEQAAQERQTEER